MGLFEKKFCDICGGKVGMLTFSKLEDGNVCADCKKKLSPFFTGRKKSTVSEIKEQIAYREQNRQNLNSFNVTRTFGRHTKIHMDDNQGCFVVSKRNDFREENADIIELSQVGNVRYEVEEHRSEIYRTDSDGKRVSYSPPRYEYEYEFTIFIDVNSPYFNHIQFELSDTRPDSRFTDLYRRYEMEANEIVNALRGNAGGMNNMGMNNAGFGVQAGFAQQQYQQQGFNQPYQQPQQGFNPQYQQPQQGFNQPYQQPQQGFNPQYQQPQQGFNPQYQQPQQGFNQQYQQPQQGFNQQYQQPQQGFNQQYQQPQQGFGQQYQQPQQGFNQQYQQPQQGFNQQYQQADNSAWVCPNCGTPCTTKFCQNCGTPKQ